MSASSSSVEQATFVVELTPVGRGAVGVVLVDGPAAIQAVDVCFAARSGRAVADTPTDQIVLGYWGGRAGEELIVCRREAHRVEVHCHGGVAASRAIIAALVTNGCEEIPWRVWCLRSSEDSIRAEARIALADAPTMRSAAVLLDQLNGALSIATQTLISAVAANDWTRANELVSDLLRYPETGLHLTTPWRVVLVGPPNVGKSSLINALAGYQRAIVSPTPGTTRDVVTLTTAIDGWPVELADTAGLRASDDELESAGVRLAQTMLATADVVILVNDITSSMAVDSAFLSSVRTERVINVWNKVDLVSQAGAGMPTDCGSQRSQTTLPTSAVTGQGVAELTKAIANVLVPAPPIDGAAVPFVPRHVELLVVAGHAIARRDGAGALDALHSLLAVGARTALFE